MLSIFFKNSYITTRFSSAALTALLLAVRPTSSRNMGPVFSHNVGDRCVSTNICYFDANGCLQCHRHS